MYYVQTNIICISLFIVIIVSQCRQSRVNTTDTLFLNSAMYHTMAYCVFDTLAWISDGRPGTFWYWMLMISNLFYLIIPDAIALIWMRYVFYKTGKENYNHGVRKWLIAGPILALILLTFTTPFTGFAFRIVEGNRYDRTVGTWIIPIFCWLYLLISILNIGRFISNRKNMAQRDNVMPLLYFFVPVLVCTAMQMAIYGLDLNTVGFTVGVVLVFLNQQYNKISIDELTGLNNRREFRNYIHQIYENDHTESLYIGMIDIDFFKNINDKYGHIEGDEVLRTVAKLLRTACSKYQHRLFLCRYGGDEFIIAGINRPGEEPEQLKHLIENLLNEWNQNTKKPYRLTLSIGYARGTLKEYPEPEKLIAMADRNMYEVKARQKIEKV